MLGVQTKTIPEDGGARCSRSVTLGRKDRRLVPSSLGLTRLGAELLECERLTQQAMGARALVHCACNLSRPYTSARDVESRVPDLEQSCAACPNSGAYSWE